MAASIKCCGRPFRGGRLGRLCAPQPKIAGSGGQRPPGKIRGEMDCFRIFFRYFWLGLPPRTLRFWAGGGIDARPDPHSLNGRPQHLIEAAKRGRLDQMIFFSAPLTTRAPPRRPAGRPAERPAERPTERPATYPPHPLGWLGVWDCSVLRCTRWVLALLGALCVQPAL